MRRPLFITRFFAFLLLVGAASVVLFAFQGCGRSDLLVSLLDGGNGQACSVSTCSNGCCDATGVCRVGTDITACGGFGSACTDCDAAGQNACDAVTQSCGVRLDICDATTCPDGCCNGSVCLVGDQYAACGTGGKSCFNCALDGRACDPQTRICGTERCGPNTCDGCCVGDTCVTGDNANSCGSKGDTCVDCGSTGQTCGTERSCAGAASCNPGNCAGCCVGERCVSGASDTTACGKNGVTCATCLTKGRCADGVCQAPPTCDARNCLSGCCSAAGQCLTGADNASCGTGGAACTSCTAGGKVCTGNACVTPTCGPGNCAGCCSDGMCVTGGVDTACGLNGAACINCAASNQACGAGGVCQATCNAGNCPGCCAGTTCNFGFVNNQCGSGGAACQNCTATAGGTCNLAATPRACTVPAMNCPAPTYAGCAMGVTTAILRRNQNVCNAADLANARAACAASPSSTSCAMFIADLSRVKPACQACLAPFEIDYTISNAGIFACAAPFVNATCNRNTGCATDCQTSTCSACPTNQSATCYNTVGTNQCRTQFTQAGCVLGGLFGTGAFCSPANPAYRGSYGAWLEGVGRNYCGP